MGETLSGRPAIRVIGAGPAGSAAAIAALRESATVQMFDRARFARHKVCGEFISAEACSVLEDLGVWREVLSVGPASIRRSKLHFGKRTKEWQLPEGAFGLSRLALDNLLLEHAGRMGAIVSRGASVRMEDEGSHVATVLACGRSVRSQQARPRLFGFKAHFEGPVDDAVELYFTESGYVGISPVEGGLMNVCGIAPEDKLRTHGFDIDEYLRGSQPLRGRLEVLVRCMEWLITGPLVFPDRGVQDRHTLPATPWALSIRSPDPAF